MSAPSAYYYIASMDRVKVDADRFLTRDGAQALAEALTDAVDDAERVDVG